MIGPTLRLNSRAPEFVAHDQDGRNVRLSEHLGQSVVLVFYVADDTPG
jgi:peroxiredoxin